MKVRVDPDLCQGHTLCTIAASEVFELDDEEGHAHPVSPDVPKSLEDAVRAAAATCPEQAIIVTE
jgi:ferredoxin